MNKDFFTVEHQMELAKKYPWTIPCDTWTGRIVDDYKYEDGTVFGLDLPKGWGYAFGDELIQELDAALQSSRLTVFIIMQAKEKYGTLRICTSAAPQSVFDVIAKYEEMSAHTCRECGAPAKMYDNGWICPYCEEHIPRDAVCIEEGPLN